MEIKERTKVDSGGGNSMKALLLQKIIFGLFTIILLLAACSGGSTTIVSSPTITNTTDLTTKIPTTTSNIPEIPSSDWFALLGYPSPEIPRISSQQLKQMMDKREPLVVIDNRPEYKFNNGHIPQSMNLPDELEAEQIAAFLTLPKDRPIILYC